MNKDELRKFYNKNFNGINLMAFYESFSILVIILAANKLPENMKISVFFALVLLYILMMISNRTSSVKNISRNKRNYEINPAGIFKGITQSPLKYFKISIKRIVRLSPGIITIFLFPKFFTETMYVQCLYEHDHNLSSKEIFEKSKEMVQPYKKDFYLNLYINIILFIFMLIGYSYFRSLYIVIAYLFIHMYLRALYLNKYFYLYYVIIKKKIK